jgi:biopolymer transport protein ExbD
MNFRLRTKEEPEINLIPFIDVLLVVLIFLMLSTTYSKFTEMQITLPSADTEIQKDYPKEVIVAIGADGSLSVNRIPVYGRALSDVVQALVDFTKANKDTVVIISADASAKHQSVVTVMEAARRAGLTQITFATQSSAFAAGH